MQIIDAKGCKPDKMANMIADFRVTLASYRGVKAEPDVAAALEELAEFIGGGFPIFAAEENGECMGYVVCRVDAPVVWVEQLYVKNEYRRRGVASMLFSKAESVARSYGEDMVYNYVHPNNIGVIEFLKKHGYTVLNMIELRKPYKNESLGKISVGDNELDY